MPITRRYEAPELMVSTGELFGVVSCAITLVVEVQLKLG